jgi:hypothetical protein
VSSENATWPELALFSSTADAPKFRLVGYTEGRAILRAGSAAVVEAYGGHVGMTEPLLHFAQVGAAIRRVGSGVVRRACGPKLPKATPAASAYFRNTQ